MRTRATRLALLAALVPLLLSGCVSLPQSGSVQTRPEQDQVEPIDGPFEFSPSGPREGASPLAVARGFLVAMEASPLSTAVAREFLSDEGRAGWLPERGTVVFGSNVLTESGRTVTASLEDTMQLDARGAWRGEAAEGGVTSYELRLVRERGEWRISNPPDALIIPRTHFETRYQQYFLYFFDPSAQILVPEPVYVPRGGQAPTMLVRRLVLGPDPALRGAVRSFIPAGTEVDLSVPVSGDGIAEVPLTEQVRDLDGEELQLVFAQIAWTLRQVSGVERMRITVGGAPLEIPDEGASQSVTAWTEFDPSIHWASQELFGIRGGKVLALSADGDRNVEGQFGAQEYALRDIAVDLPAEQVAGVTDDGTTVVVAPRGREPDLAPPAASTVEIYRGTDVLRPAWDIYGQVWLVDRARSGATVVVRRGGVVAPVPAPGIAGQDITSFTLSRDGTRFVAVVAAPGDDRVLVSRVLRDREGRVRGMTRAETLAVGPGGIGEIRDVAWRTPGSLALLTGASPRTSEVVLARVDGSSVLGGDSLDAEVFLQRAVHLVASPTPGTPLYLGTRNGRVYALASDGQWAGPVVRGGLQAPVFVG